MASVICNQRDPRTGELHRVECPYASDDDPVELVDGVCGRYDEGTASCELPGGHWQDIAESMEEVERDA